MISQNHMNKHSNEEDVDFAPEEEMGDIGAAQAKIRKLKEELAAAKAERQEYLDGWQRCKADSINARKEMFASAEKLGVQAKEMLVEDLIPALDGFDMAAGSAAWQNVDPQWRNGIEQIRGQLVDALARHGVERFGTAGEPVDHAAHETVEERDEAEGESGTIVKVLRSGYRMKGRIIRPAQVIVKK